MAIDQNSVLIAENMRMPIIGLGTWMSTDEETERAIDAALECGYRHIDTAFVYYNETAIGNALQRWLSSGKIRREELFIVTKLPMFANRAEHVEFMLKKSLASLQLSYVDLYLIHNAAGVQFKNEDPFPRGEDGKILLDMEIDHISLWKAMEKQVDEGRARAIGISNFNQKQVKRLVENSRIKPANLQVELHIYLQQKELVKYCKENGVTVCAYAPLGSPQMVDFTQKIGLSTEGVPEWTPMTDPLVKSLAQKYNKSPSQILIRFLLQYGVATIPKSSNPDRIKLNFNVFDFKLEEDDYNKLVSLDKGEAGRMFAKGIFGELKSHPEYPF